MAGKELSTDEVERTFYEAERDCIPSSYPFIKGWVYELIPREDRGTSWSEEDSENCTT